MGEEGRKKVDCRRKRREVSQLVRKKEKVCERKRKRKEKKKRKKGGTTWGVRVLYRAIKSRVYIFVFENFPKTIVITVSRSTWMTTNIKMESPPIFSVRV